MNKNEVNNEEKRTIYFLFETETGTMILLTSQDHEFSLLYSSVWMPGFGGWFGFLVSRMGQIQPFNLEFHNM